MQRAPTFATRERRIGLLGTGPGALLIEPHDGVDRGIQTLDASEVL